jgi:hypothetical protein
MCSASYVRRRKQQEGEGKRREEREEKEEEKEKKEKMKKICKHENFQKNKIKDNL